MEVKNTPLLFQQDVNRFYKDICNNEISPPPYWEGNVPETFFLKKRKGIGVYKNFEGDSIIDFIEFDGEEYGMVRDGTNIVVKKYGTPLTTIATQPFNSEHYHSFKEGFISAAGTLQDDGTVTSSAETSGIFTIEDTSKSWTVNEFATNYIIITNGTGAGQVIRISSNTSDTLTLQNGRDSAPVAGSIYKIFPNYAEVLAFIGDDGIYIIHNDTNITKLTGFGSVKDACYFNGRIFAIDDNRNVLSSATETNDGTFALYGGFLSAYTNGSSIVGATAKGMRIEPFNNVVLIFTPNRIDIVKTLSADKSGTSFESFVVNVGTKFVGLLSKGAIYSYNTGLYLVTNKRKFVSLNISDGFQGQYKITTEDMGINIQQWLDNIKDDDIVTIGINNEEIYLVWNNDDGTTIFKYNYYYSFWYRRETELAITNINIGTKTIFTGGSTYIYNTALKNDVGDKSFIQHIRLFDGEANIFSLKTILYHKLFLGKNTNLKTTVTYEARLSQGTYKYVIPFKNIAYLQKATGLSGDGTLGTNILGYGIFGGNAEKSLIDSFIADIDVIEIPLGLTYSLLEITIAGDFEIGGMLLGAEVHQPHLTAYEDVASYI